MKKFETLEEAQSAFDLQSEENDALKKENSNQAKALKQQQADLKEMDQLIQDIRRQPTSNGKFKTFTSGKKKFEIRAENFYFNKTKYTAQDVVNNTALQAELLKANVGFLVESED